MENGAVTDSENADGTEEWPAGTPVIGFKNLFRFALLASLLALPNLACQIYLLRSLEATGTENSVTPASAVWACVLGFAGSAHMLWVSYRGLKKYPGTKCHLVVALVTCFIACVLLISGMGISAESARYTEPLSRGVVGECVYFNSTYTVNNYPYAQNLVRRKDGICRGCDLGGYYNNAKRRSTCCCCAQSLTTDNSPVNLYGVSGCSGVKDAVYPVSATSAILHGICLLLMSICFVVGCIVACQCYCCNPNCGPFPKPTGRWQNRHLPSVFPPQTVAPPVAGAAAPENRCPDKPPVYDQDVETQAIPTAM